MSGQLFGLGVGPGDPELMTLKSLRLLKDSPVVAYLAARGRKGRALSIVEGFLSDSQERLPLVYPVTTESLPSTAAYDALIRQFYDESAEVLATRLQAGQNVALVCEGDPFFYGSFMYFHDRLADRFPTTVVPGVCSVLACAAGLGTPLVYRNQTLSVLSGVLPEEELKARLRGAEAAAIMKLGTNYRKVRAVIRDLGLLDHALYAERATMADQRLCALKDLPEDENVPYFAMILLPGDRWEATS
ncbi:precorrin-2 C(20)-methyltransferase [Phaeovibrio sulfidiphilus]|uniref:Precorrin-2 C(20)-methyltransferase n=1 Tax=Phaeovibrio sulfidiphilus TaxID=1220600 RepID=A0A8J7CDL0_9PROT|nr:precorrin-2 C(20)-methyltransferase [Phaeovibrio sulfidiphilus]MBE1237848.1 precorrin-2 C(20)-methyltransferase [Phaeovibrio sulfidiphilus]